MFGDEWIAVVAETLAKLAASPVPEGPELLVDYVISGSPSGKVTIGTVVDGGVVRSVVSGKSDTPDVVVSMKYDVALEILQGERSSDGAYMTGALKVEGAHEKWMLDLRTVRAAAIEALAPLTAEFAS